MRSRGARCCSASSAGVGAFRPGGLPAPRRAAHRGRPPIQAPRGAETPLHTAPRLRPRRDNQRDHRRGGRGLGFLGGLGGGGRAPPKGGRPPHRQGRPDEQGAARDVGGRGVPATGRLPRAGDRAGGAASPRPSRAPPEPTGRAAGGREGRGRALRGGGLPPVCGRGNPRFQRTRRYKARPKPCQPRGVGISPPRGRFHTTHVHTTGSQLSIGQSAENV
mmetsp:Transcript_29607/g.66380  ORF Transcript_29607/g.66380 Transcript_29607/m.66380 type:complete len:219 (-) Transcript_29607:64-720(-)